MTDRELLERAARGLGWRLVSHTIVPGGTAVVAAEGRTFCWRPLTDDGDALRLAVARRMDIEFPTETRRQHPAASVVVYGDEVVELPLGDDAAAALRRAIVVAAAYTHLTP